MSDHHFLTDEMSKIKKQLLALSDMQVAPSGLAASGVKEAAHTPLPSAANLMRIDVEKMIDSIRALEQKVNSDEGSMRTSKP